MHKLLVVADIQHASPRVPSLVHFFSKYGWDVKIISPGCAKDIKKHVGLLNEEKVEIVSFLCPYDIWSPYRKIIKRFFSKGDAGDDGGEYQGGLLNKLADASQWSSAKSALRSMMNVYRLVRGAFPDDYVTARQNWVAEGVRVAENWKPDVLLSSSPHPTAHVCAKAISIKTGIVWVAEFRDLWTMNHSYEYGWLHKIIDRLLERRTMVHARELVTVTPSFKKKLEDMHHRPVSVFTNGFFRKNPRLGVSKNRKMTFLYTGLVYEGKQNLRLLFEIFHEVIFKACPAANENIEVVFLGPKPISFDGYVAQYNLECVFRHGGMHPREYVIERQAEADVLLLLNWDDPDETDVYPTKLFEYMACDGVLLATGGHLNDNVRKIVEETQSGVYAISKEEAVEFIAHAYNDWVCGSLGNSVTKDVEKYSMAAIAFDYSRFLKQVVLNAG
ncbi:hypothetical protein OTERR_25580 [Oryzomicrobium terrae]|uniref:Uncharacterized protein n=1 Tax=Oryzomicrobium terrae TaxID=1735038 RepID=A0A5C1EBH1_9RHOO|nr:glycosyltransferase [Oryzomicrobium terrae]QEL66034.1 hypothetical protein OTERR_25580 [Oryzomicrobium terrae]